MVDIICLELWPNLLEPSWQLRGEVICEVTTHKALDAAMKKEIEGVINGKLQKGQKSLISYHVDPSIVGGMIVSIGDKHADMSIASKLKKYTAVIQSAA